MPSRPPAFERELGVGCSQEGHVLDRVFEIEVLERGDVEVGGMEMGLDQSGHDRSSARVDTQDTIGGKVIQGGGRTAVAHVRDSTFFGDHAAVRDRRGIVPDQDHAVGDAERVGCCFHACVPCSRFLGI
jgi:hypothetical protein